MTTRTRKAAAVVAMLVGMAGFAGAAPPTFRIEQVSTTPDGYSQTIELKEFAGLDGHDNARVGREAGPDTTRSSAARNRG